MTGPWFEVSFELILHQMAKHLRPTKVMDVMTVVVMPYGACSH